MSPIRLPKPVKYTPLSIRTILLNMKNLSSLMVDLAYYSLIYMDRRLALELLKLEDYIDQLWSQVVMHSSLAVRDAEDAESMVGVMKMASSFDRISDAAADIAMLVLMDYKPSLTLTAAIMESEEVVTRVKIHPSSEVCNKKLEEVFNTLGTTVDVIAIRRNDTWSFSPQLDFKILENDILIVRGSHESINIFRKAAKDEEYHLTLQDVPKDMRELGRKLKEFKNLCEFMVDIAYTALLSNDRTLALEVLDLEDYIDSMHLSLEKEILQHFKEHGKVEEIIPIERLVIALENIADAAAELAGIVIMGIKLHPIMLDVIEASDERILKAKIKEKLHGKTIGYLKLEDLGALILAIRRGNQWYVAPREEFILHANDDILVKCYAENYKRLIQMLRKLGMEVYT